MTRLNDKPFALIGVNTNVTDPKELKEVMDKEQISWRTFVTNDTINANWNNPGTPLYFVIDPQGVIRHKWFGSPGEKALDRAVETLLEKAQKKEPPK